MNNFLGALLGFSLAANLGLGFWLIMARDDLKWTESDRDWWRSIALDFRRNVDRKVARRVIKNNRRVRP